LLINGEHFRSIWLNDDGWRVNIIDQTTLPFNFSLVHLSTLQDAACAISDMNVRGAPLIGATAAYGIALTMRNDAGDSAIQIACDTLHATRPTAVNLPWALGEMKQCLLPLPEKDREIAAYNKAAEICDADVKTCKSIGEHGLKIVRKLWEEKGKPNPFHILTHCNAGWLACVDWGTALAPIYLAHDAGIPVHVWVDETRPRNQGAALTAFELGAHGVPHTVIADNAGGHLMQIGQVHMVIVGSDRTTFTGDVCNKIGTYLKALAAHESHVPFYVALPSTTIDWSLANGSAIPIEMRNPVELSHVRGQASDGSIQEVRLIPSESRAKNYAFDVTPAKYVSGLITERGICTASEDGITSLFPERKRKAAE